MTFENYLMDICPSHTNNGPEGFERWLEDLDQEELMCYADDYTAELVKTIESIQKLIKKIPQ